MTEDEKNAIKFLKETNFDYLDYDMCVSSVETTSNLVVRLQKENEQLKEINEELSENKLLQDIEIKKNFISKQKIKDIINRIDYDIKKTKEIISNNSNIYTNDRRNDYQIVRLKAMNTKSLDIKKRLQELLESEE